MNNINIYAIIKLIFFSSIAMGMSQEQAAAAMHAAKFAQLGSMGHNIDKLSSGMPQQIDLSKLRESQLDIDNKHMSTSSVTIEPSLKFNSSHNDKEISRRSSEPMDLGHENINDNRRNHDDQTNDNDGVSSGDEGSYSDGDGTEHS